RTPQAGFRTRRSVGGDAGAVLDAEPARRSAVHLERRARLGHDVALHLDRHGTLAHAGPRRGDAGPVLREHGLVDVPVVAVRVLGWPALRRARLALGPRVRRSRIPVAPRPAVPPPRRRRLGAGETP